MAKIDHSLFVADTIETLHLVLDYISLLEECSSAAIGHFEAIDAAHLWPDARNNFHSMTEQELFEAKHGLIVSLKKIASLLKHERYMIERRRDAIQ